jgi:hypothetical protein
MRTFTSRCRRMTPLPARLCCTTTPLEDAATSQRQYTPAAGTASRYHHPSRSPLPVNVEALGSVHAAERLETLHGNLRPRPAPPYQPMSPDPHCREPAQAARPRRLGGAHLRGAGDKLHQSREVLLREPLLGTHLQPQTRLQGGIGFGGCCACGTWTTLQNHWICGESRE